MNARAPLPMMQSYQVGTPLPAAMGMTGTPRDRGSNPLEGCMKTITGSYALHTITDHIPDLAGLVAG